MNERVDAAQVPARGLGNGTLKDVVAQAAAGVEQTRVKRGW